jgi:urea transporter
MFHRDEFPVVDKLQENTPEAIIMSFGLYLLGFALLVIGIAYGAHMAHVPTHWIIVAVVTLVGIGIMTGVSRTRMRDPY